MSFLLLIVLSGLVAADVAAEHEDSPLPAIINRYGGEGKLIEAEELFQEGRRCTLGDCRDFRSYRNGRSNIRVEEAFSPPLWRVRVVQGNAAREFFVGPWWKRAWFSVAGVRNGPIPPDEIPGTLLDSQSLLLGFLREAQRSRVTYVGKAVTLDGRPAHIFEQDLPERKATAQYLFDLETLLCLQRTLVMHSKQEPFSFAVFGDYRDVNGLPYPFRTQVIDARRKVPVWDETLSSVRMGRQLEVGLFTAPPIDPLWIFPLKAFGLAAVIGALLVWILRRRKAGSSAGSGVPA